MGIKYNIYLSNKYERQRVDKITQLEINVDEVKGSYKSKVKSKMSKKEKTFIHSFFQKIKIIPSTLVGLLYVICKEKQFIIKFKKENI